MQALNSAIKHAHEIAHLDVLEAEAIHIVREAVAEAERPVLLYSIGKDSSALLHVMRKAFYPSKLPMPVLHIDTLWKFREMIEFRDRCAIELGLDLRVYVNPEGRARNINPIDHGSREHTEIMKTRALRQALEENHFDVAIGGARRDEEAIRSKERIFSLRNERHQWDPRVQRAELWHIYNTRKNAAESLRVFPLSNWTELDVWRYIQREKIPVVPLYFAAERPVLERDGLLIMRDDDRLQLRPGEKEHRRWVRFRTLGCYPLTGAMESRAASVAAIIEELRTSRFSERVGRLIDRDSAHSMEEKKRDGYF